MDDDALELAAFVEQNRQRIRCPIPWCEGRAFEHGRGGRARADYLHTGTAIVAPQGWAAPHQTGGARPAWTVELEWHEYDLMPEQLARVAQELRRFAADIEARAGEPL